MPEIRLILFEGVPGSGKTTAALHLQEYLAKQGFAVRFWREGDFDHPADFEGVACLDETGYRNLISRYPSLAAQLRNNIIVHGRDYLLKYRKLQQLQQIPQALTDELAGYDVYDGLPMQEYCRLALQRWQEFQESLKNSNAIALLECCFLQNPLTVMLARHNADPQMAQDQVIRITEAIRSLHPLVIYLHPVSVRAALEHVRAERPTEWADFVTGYLTGQEYGKAHGLTGYEGVIQFYEMRQALEVDILRDLSVRSRVFEHAGREWDRCDNAVLEFVRSHLPTCPDYPLGQ